MIQGYIDQIDSRVSGWVVDRQNPTSPVMVEIFVDGVSCGVTKANVRRPDLSQLGFGIDTFGFDLGLPDISLAGLPIVFGKVGDAFIMPTPMARESRLARALHHLHLMHVPERPSVLHYQPPAPVPERRFVDRLISAFRHAKQSTETDLGPIWGSLVAGRHGEAIELCRRGDAAMLGDYLARLGQTDLAWGFFGGPEAHEAALTSPEYQRQIALLIMDRLLSLAEFLGCTPLDNPEQGPWGASARLSTDELLGRVAEALAIDITPPRRLGSYWGLATRFGVFDSRILDAIHAAARIKQVLSTSGGNGVLEIGGGAGLVACYARRLGVARYTIVDLPTVALVQGFMLSDEPGLRLQTEPGMEPVRLAAPWEYATLPDLHPADLLFNMDSLPEMETNTAVDYLTGAREMGLRTLLSINQESGGEVGEWSQGKLLSLTRRAGQFQLLSRHRSWMRPGYAEELFRIG